MPIPNAESAFVSPEKLTDYLLQVGHPVGGPKAKWFLSVGYAPDKPEDLKRDLLQIVRTSVDYVEVRTKFGVKYTVPGEVRTPDGGRASIRTVWISETPTSSPRLVTAYPEPSKKDE